MPRGAAADAAHARLEFTPNGYGSWRIKETATHYVDVAPMIFNDRICLTPKVAALAWDPDTEAEPTGFKKRIAMGSPRSV